MDNNYLFLPEFVQLVEHTLINYLSPLEIYNIYKDINLFEKCTILNINTRLKYIFGNYYNDFKKGLNESNLSISGSFILQCMLGEKWESDIDLIYYDKEQEKVSFLRNILLHYEDGCYHKNYDNTGEFKAVTNFKSGKFLDKIINKPPSRNILISNCLIKINGLDYSINETKELFGEDVIDNFVKNEPNIQIIKYDHEIFDLTKDKNVCMNSLFNYICNNYDFDVCSNLFYVENGIDKLKIFNFDGIINKTIETKKINILTLSNRIIKYLNRGFKFNNAELNDIINHRKKNKLDTLDPNGTSRVAIINKSKPSEYFSKYNLEKDEKCFLLFDKSHVPKFSGVVLYDHVIKF